MGWDTWRVVGSVMPRSNPGRPAQCGEGWLLPLCLILVNGSHEKVQMQTDCRMESVLRLVLAVFVCTCDSCTAFLRPVLIWQAPQGGSGWNREHLDFRLHVAGTPPLQPCITSA